MFDAFLDLCYNLWLFFVTFLFLLDLYPTFINFTAVWTFTLIYLNKVKVQKVWRTLDPEPRVLQPWSSGGSVRTPTSRRRSLNCRSRGSVPRLLSLMIIEAFRLKRFVKRRFSKHEHWADVNNPGRKPNDVQSRPLNEFVLKCFVSSPKDWAEGSAPQDLCIV